MQKGIVLFGVLFFMLAFSSAAFAHAEIASCTPPINGTVDSAPAQLVCKASESLDPKGSTLAVYDAMGMQVDKKDSTVDLNDPDRVTISVSLDTAMVKDGEYTVKWTTVSSADGDKESGEFKFTVGQGGHGHSAPTAEPTDSTIHPNGDESVGIATLNGKEITLKIASPLNGAQVPAGIIKVETALDGAKPGENDSHIHFYLDKGLRVMSQGDQTSALVEIQEPGEHEIQATYSQGDHTDLIKVRVLVNVVAGNNAAQTTVTTVPTPSTPATAAPTAVPTQVAQATTAPTAAPTASTGGGDSNMLTFGVAALVGVIAIGALAFFVMRGRR